jgi:hypothetical protein
MMTPIASANAKVLPLYLVTFSEKRSNHRLMRVAILTATAANMEDCTAQAKSSVKPRRK